MKTQVYVSTEDGEFFDISFNTDDISFKIIELTYREIREITYEIQLQTDLLLSAYQSSASKANKK